MRITFTMSASTLPGDYREGQTDSLRKRKRKTPAAPRNPRDRRPWNPSFAKTAKMGTRQWHVKDRNISSPQRRCWYPVYEQFYFEVVGAGKLLDVKPHPGNSSEIRFSV